MKGRILAYLAYLDSLDLSTPDPELAKRILAQIRIAQHERLIHLMVTLAFGICDLMAYAVLFATGAMGAFVMALVLLVLLVPYIFYYYFMENSVQKMYGYYDKAAGETFMEFAGAKGK